MRKLAALVICWCIVLAANVQVAFACTPLRDCMTLVTVFPPNGAREVPPNAELRLQYVWTGSTDQRPSDLPSLSASDGSTVSVDWIVDGGLVRGRPQQRLLPGTLYELRHPFERCSSTDTSGCDLCRSAPGSVVSTFAVEGPIDEELPAKPDFAQRVSPTSRVIESAACGPYTRCDVALDVPERRDLTYRFYSNDKLVGEYAGPISIAVYEAGDRSGPGGYSFRQEGQASYGVHAVDFAGNVSAATTLSVPACAEPLVLDGGAGPGGAADSAVRDASLVVADSGADAGDLGDGSAGSSSSGCGVAAGHYPPWSLFLPLGLVSFWRRKVRA
jgi:hypothetical protein